MKKLLLFLSSSILLSNSTLCVVDKKKDSLMPFIGYSTGAAVQAGFCLFSLPWIKKIAKQVFQGNLDYVAPSVASLAITSSSAYSAYCFSKSAKKAYAQSPKLQKIVPTAAHLTGAAAQIYMLSKYLQLTYQELSDQMMAKDKNWSAVLSNAWPIPLLVYTACKFFGSAYKAFKKNSPMQKGEHNETI